MNDEPELENVNPDQHTFEGILLATDIWAETEIVVDSEDVVYGSPVLTDNSDTRFETKREVKKETNDIKPQRKTKIGSEEPFNDKEYSRNAKTLYSKVGEICRRGTNKVVVISVHPNGSMKCYGYPKLVRAVLESNVYEKLEFSAEFPSENPVSFPKLKAYSETDLDGMHVDLLNRLLLVVQYSLTTGERTHLYRSHKKETLDTPPFWPPRVDFRSQFGNENILIQKQPDGIRFESRKQALVYIIRYMIYWYQQELWNVLELDVEGGCMDSATQTQAASNASVVIQTESQNDCDVAKATKEEPYRFRHVKGGKKFVCGCPENTSSDPAVPIKVHLCPSCNIRTHTLCSNFKCFICRYTPDKRLSLSSKL